MSVSRVRHRGEAPRDIDHGPSTGAAHAQGAAAAVARLGAFTTASLVPTGGAGPIERRMATEAQREAWRAELATPTPARVPMRVKLEVDGVHAKGSAEERAVASKARQADHRARAAADRPAMGSPEHLQASRMRGGERNRQLVATARVLGTVTGPTVTAHTLEEEPAMAIEPPPIIQRSPETQALLDLAAATSRTDAAWEAFHAADVARFLAEDEYELARRDLVRAIAAVREAMALEDAPPATTTNATFAEVPSANRAEQRHERLSNGEAAEPGDDAPEVVTAAPVPDGLTDPRPMVAAGGGPGPLTKRQAEILAVVVRHAGDRRAASNELRVAYQTIDTILEGIGKRGLLPAALIASLPARFAKYTGV